MSDKPILVLENISKYYHQGRSIIEVLKNINLTVLPGEMIAIAGASGSGKSTLLHIAGLLDKPNTGMVSLAGIAKVIKPSLQNAHKIRLDNIGFVYQYHHLLKDFNAQENAAMPLIIKGEHKELAIRKAADLLDSLGLGNRLYNVPGELSGGEQQRVAIARALINDPKIIFADEPTGNLDPSTAEDVFNLFLDRAQDKKTAVVMVTHNITLLSRMHKSYHLDNNLNIIKQ